MNDKGKRSSIMEKVSVTKFITLMLRRVRRSSFLLSTLVIDVIICMNSDAGVLFFAWRGG